MEFTVSTCTLLDALRDVCDIKHCSVRILKYFLFEIKERDMTIFAANLETVMSSKLKVKSNDCGYFAMSPRVLLDILKCLPEQLLTFKINKKSFRVEIISECCSEKISGANAKKLKQEISKRHPNIF